MFKFLVECKVVQCVWQFVVGECKIELVFDEQEVEMLVWNCVVWCSGCDLYEMVEYIVLLICQDDVWVCGWINVISKWCCGKCGD